MKNNDLGSSKSKKKNCCVIQTNNELEMTSSIFPPGFFTKELIMNQPLR